MDSTLELLDTPGILWPRFDDPEVGKRLAFTGAIKDDVEDMEELACCLMDYLSRRYAPVLAERYKIEVEPEDSGYDLLEKAGRKRGFLMRGAQPSMPTMKRLVSVPPTHCAWQGNQGIISYSVGAISISIVCLWSAPMPL